MEKWCGGCNQTKSIKEFSKHKGSQDGYRLQCKDCAKAYEKSEKGKEARSRYKQSKKGRQTRKLYEQSDERKQSKKLYRQSEKGKEVARHYAQSQEGRQRRNRYEQSDKGRQNAKKNKAIRRTNETQAGGSHTTDQWFDLCKFHDFRCLKCNKKFPFKKLTLDHVRPVSKGGSSDIWNTQPLCKKCNSRKKDKEIDYRKTLPDWINRDGPVWQQDTLF